MYWFEILEIYSLSKKIKGESKLKKIKRITLVFLVSLLSISGFASGAFASEEVISENEEKYKRDLEFIKQSMVLLEDEFKQTDLLMEEYLNEEDQDLDYSYNDHNQLAAPTKSVIRNASKAAATGAQPFLPLTAATLKHSAQDKPTALSYKQGTSMSNKIKSSTAFKNELAKFKKKLPAKGTYYSYNGSMALSSPKDLYLALNKVSYLMAAEKVNGKWKIYTHVMDTYNFEYWNMKDLPVGTELLKSFINNYGYVAMSTGALNPYPINVYITN